MPSTLRHKANLAIPQHFLVALRRSLLHYVAREPMVGSSKTMNPSTLHTLRSAIADSIGSRSVPSVRVPDIESAVRFIERNFHDVDWDPFPDRITIFGDDPSVPVSPDGDGDEAHFVLEILR